MADPSRPVAPRMPAKLARWRLPFIAWALRHHLSSSSIFVSSHAAGISRPSRVGENWPACKGRNGGARDSRCSRQTVEGLRTQQPPRKCNLLEMLRGNCRPSPAAAALALPYCACGAWVSDSRGRCLSRTHPPPRHSVRDEADLVRQWLPHRHVPFGRARLTGFSAAGHILNGVLCSGGVLPRQQAIVGGLHQQAAVASLAGNSARKTPRARQSPAAPAGCCESTCTTGTPVSGRMSCTSNTHLHRAGHDLARLAARGCPSQGSRSTPQDETPAAPTSSCGKRRIIMILDRHRLKW